MKTFNLTIAALAIAAAASTSAFAATMDSNGNIPNHGSDVITGYNDSASSDQMFATTATPSNSDALFIQLKANTDKNLDRN